MSQEPRKMRKYRVAFNFMCKDTPEQLKEYLADLIPDALLCPDEEVPFGVEITEEEITDEDWKEFDKAQGID